MENVDEVVDMAILVDSAKTFTQLRTKCEQLPQGKQRAEIMVLIDSFREKLSNAFENGQWQEAIEIAKKG